MLAEKLKKIEIEEADFSKVFGFVLHDLLIAKLLSYGSGSDMLAIKLIYTYLSGTKNRVKINDKYSSWKKIFFDIPQGSILRLLLFNIFTCDLFLFKNDILCC